MNRHTQSIWKTREAERERKETDREREREGEEKRRSRWCFGKLSDFSEPEEERRGKENSFKKLRQKLDHI